MLGLASVRHRHASIGRAGRRAHGEAVGVATSRSPIAAVASAACRSGAGSLALRIVAAAGHAHSATACVTASIATCVSRRHERVGRRRDRCIDAHGGSIRSGIHTRPALIAARGANQENRKDGGSDKRHGGRGHYASTRSRSRPLLSWCRNHPKELRREAACLVSRQPPRSPCSYSWVRPSLRPRCSPTTCLTTTSTRRCSTGLSL